MNLPKNGSGLANSLIFVTGLGLGLIPAVLIYFSFRASSTGEDAVGSATGSSTHFSLQPQDSLPAQRRAAELIEAALLQTEPGVRAEALRQAGAAAAREDIRKALRFALTLPSAQDRLEFHRGLFGVWAEDDPQAALDHAHSNFEAGLLQSEAIGIAMNKWGSHNPGEAWVWAEQHLSGPLRERAMTDLMIGWTRRTPETAADWLKNSGFESQPVLNAVARTWAEQAPELAAAWARDLPEGMARQTAETAVASEWAAQDPQRAAEHFDERIADEGGLSIAIALADVWGTTDPAAAAAWLQSLPQSSNRAEAAGVLATVWGATDIAAAAAWTTGLQDDAMRRKAITHLGTTWGALDPVDALDWLNSLPRSEAADGITGAFYSWAGTNPGTMQEWIQTAPADALTDRARRSLGDVLSHRDPVASMNLALGMSTGVQREETAARYFREWRKRDDSSAQQWLQEQWGSLAPGVQEHLAVEQARNVVPR